MPNKWHKCKESQAGNEKRQRRGLLLFSELPGLPSADSRSGCFHSLSGLCAQIAQFFLPIKSI
jgi:hypothetical protein